MTLIEMAMRAREDLRESARLLELARVRHERAVTQFDQQFTAEALDLDSGTRRYVLFRGYTYLLRLDDKGVPSAEVVNVEEVS